MVSPDTELVLVTAGDMPLLRADTLRDLVQLQEGNPGAFSMLTVEFDDPHGFGRVLRSADGYVRAVVEEAAAGPEVLPVRELNASAYCFRAAWLWPALRRVKLSAKGEYYLTDLVEIAVQDGLSVRALVAADPSEAIGINTRVHLAEAEAILRRRIAERLMLAGVTLVDPASTYIEETVTIGADTTVWPNTYLRGKTSIGEGCSIGPDAILENTTVGDNCRILASYLESALLEDERQNGAFLPPAPRRAPGKGRQNGQLWRSEGLLPGRGRPHGTLLLHRGCEHRRSIPTSAPGRSLATTMARANSRRRSAKMRSSAAIQCWSRR